MSQILKQFYMWNIPEKNKSLLSQLSYSVQEVGKKTRVFHNECEWCLTTRNRIKRPIAVPLKSVRTSCQSGSFMTRSHAISISGANKKKKEQKKRLQPINSQDGREAIAEKRFSRLTRKGVTPIKANCYPPIRISTRDKREWNSPALKFQTVALRRKGRSWRSKWYESVYSARKSRNQVSTIGSCNLWASYPISSPFVLVKHAILAKKKKEWQFLLFANFITEF